jgi:hypothetical protein
MHLNASNSRHDPVNYRFKKPMSEFLEFQNDDQYTLRQSYIILRNWNCQKIYFSTKKKIVEQYAALIAYATTVAIIATHSAMSYYWSCNTTFQRGGADISLVAAALFAFVSWYSIDGFKLSGGAVPKLNLLNPNLALPVVALTGTLIWGYGDALVDFGNCSTGNYLMYQSGQWWYLSTN